MEEALMNNFKESGSNPHNWGKVTYQKKSFVLFWTRLVSVCKAYVILIGYVILHSCGLSIEP